MEQTEIAARHARAQQAIAHLRAIADALERGDYVPVIFLAQFPPHENQAESTRNIVAGVVGELKETSAGYIMLGGSIAARMFGMGAVPGTDLH